MFLLLSGLFALAGAVLLILASAITLNAVKRYSISITQLLLPAIILISALVVLISNRDLTYVGLSLTELIASGSFYSNWLDRLTIYGVIFLALLGCFDAFLNYKNQYTPSKLTLIFYSGLIYFFFTLIIASFFSSHRSMSTGALTQPLLFALIFLDKRYTFDKVINSIRNITLFVIFLGLVLLVLKPGIVAEGHKSGLFGLLSFRYWGLSPHANAMGPFALMALILVYIKPFSRNYLNYISVLASLSALLLSQSKTSLIILLLFVSIYYIAYVLTRINAGSSIKSWKVKDIFFLLFLFISLISIILSPLMFDVDTALDKLNKLDIGGNLYTLSGRTQIWDIALSEWQANPMFGYGVTIFDEEFRRSIGMNFAFHAHNQILQVMAQSGLVGLITFLFFYFTLTYKSIKLAKSSSYATIFLFVLVSIRMITEVPIRIGTATSTDFIIFILWCLVLKNYDVKALKK